MGPLTLEFKKKADAGTVLTCIRADGSATSDDVGPARGFGPMHDLCHFVVERWFGFREGFLGLVAGGWSIQDFEAPGVPASLPFEAGQAEWLAGTLSTDLGANQQFDPEAYYMAYDATFKKSWPDREPAALTAEDLRHIREEVREYLLEWNQVPVNEALRVTFDPSAPPRRESIPAG